MPRLNDLLKKLEKHGVDAKTLRKLVKLCRDNPDPMSFMIGQYDTSATVSPIVSTMLKDKPFIRVLAGIHLYNIILLEYKDSRYWTFRCIDSKSQHQYFDHVIDRIDATSEEPWVFDAAVAQTLISFLEYQEERVRLMKEQQEKVAAEIEYNEIEATT